MVVGARKKRHGRRKKLHCILMFRNLQRYTFHITIMMMMNILSRQCGRGFGLETRGLDIMMIEYHMKRNN
jgi:hypothetical protein